MKFQYTKHKELWNRIIKKIESINVSNDGFKPFYRLHMYCQTDKCSYACDYGRSVGGSVNMCKYCPIESCIMLGNPLYDNLIRAYSHGDMDNAIKYAKLIRDIPVKKGVELE